MYLMRFVYDRLLDWKNEGGHSTLEVGGARQVGKTYLIQKFADENYKHKIYINLFELSGKQFMECYKQATNWTPGTRTYKGSPNDIAAPSDTLNQWRK